ncbi:pilus assembly FimT family protein [Teredinibacter haidensis]|uniref:pilus assembly FimT family protein n=1 Tax=Teredinibacter haidensis TaxID=2731755 RepID=UPI00163BD3CD|nr:type II secretion system protein [Teredinibacter haidensis]
MKTNVTGFTLVELITVMLIIGILAVTALTKILPSDTLQLQASRDSIVAAFYSAQQLAMVRQSSVEVRTSVNQIDVLVDNVSVSAGGVSYPLVMLKGQTLNIASFGYDRLGHTTGSQLYLTQNGRVVTIVVDDSGYVK